MKIETLKPRKKKYFLYALIVGVILLLPLVLSITFGKYQTRESIKLVEGSITYKPYELNVVAVNIENDNGEYTYSEDIPTSGYYLDDSKSYCEVKNVKDNSIKLEYTGSKLEVTDISKKGTRCYVYFNKAKSKVCPSGASACETIMENTNTIGERTDFGKTVTVTTTGIMYQAEDDYGTSYYFAGAPTDNWVKFAGMYWRIIRINGDGTIRMIYSGNETNGPATTGLATQIGTSAFNSSYNDNAYVGYKYTLGDVHGTGTDSTIKKHLDNWFDNNLASYASYIDTNSEFCGDRNIASGHSSYMGDGTGTSKTIYAPADRIFNTNLESWKVTQIPTLKCSNSNDLYTLSNSSIGNKALNKPIGLITIDEILYGGGFGGTANQSYYLYTGLNYWTMFPSVLFNSEGREFFVYLDGTIHYTFLSVKLSVHPVINLRSDVTLTGSGTSIDPYVVS